MLVGCYSLHLYCDVDAGFLYEKGHDAGPGEFSGRTFAESVREARQDGWIVRRDRTSNCGYHVRCPIHRSPPEAKP